MPVSNILNGCNRPRRIPAYKDSKVFKERHPVKAADNAWNIANASSMYDFCEKMEIIGHPRYLSMDMRCPTFIVLGI